MLEIVLCFLVIAGFSLFCWIAFTLQKKHVFLDRMEVRLTRRAKRLTDREGCLEYQEMNLRHREEAYEANRLALAGERQAFEESRDRWLGFLGDKDNTENDNSIS